MGDKIRFTADTLVDILNEDDVRVATVESGPRGRVYVNHKSADYIDSSVLRHCLDLIERDGNFGALKPKAKVRPYANAIEAAVLVGRNVVCHAGVLNPPVEVTFVGKATVKLAPDGWDSFRNLAEYYTFADTNEPCGVPDPA